MPVRYLLIVFAPRHAPSIGVEVGSAFAAFFLDEDFLKCVRASASAAEVHDGFDDLLEHLTVVPHVYLGENRETASGSPPGAAASPAGAAPTLGEISAARRQSDPFTPTAPSSPSLGKNREERKVMFADPSMKSSTDVCSDVVSNNLKSYRSMRKLADISDGDGATLIEPIETLDTLEARTLAPREAAPRRKERPPSARPRAPHHT